MVIFGYTVSEEKIVDFMLLYGAQMLSAVVILIVGIIAAKCVRNIAERVMKRAKLDAILVNFLSKILYCLLMIFVIIATLNNLGVQTASLIAVLGAAGLAIGLALQGSLSNFAAGIMIIVLKHFKIGDVIVVNNVTGIVDDMNIFTTTLHTPGNEKLVIPNNTITSNILTNITANKQRRIDLVVGVGYNDDLDKVTNLLNTMIQEDVLILKDPEPFIGVDALADNSVNFVIRVWALTSDYGVARSGLLKRIKQEFDRNGISIPFPQREMQVNFTEETRSLFAAQQNTDIPKPRPAATAKTTPAKAKPKTKKS